MHMRVMGWSVLEWLFTNKHKRQRIMSGSTSWDPLTSRTTKDLSNFYLIENACG